MEGINRISEGLQNRLGGQLRSILVRTKNNIVEITIIAKTENNESLYQEAYSFAQLPKIKTEIRIFEPDEFFEKIMDNDAEALETLRFSEVSFDNGRFITPLKALANSGKVFGQKELIEVTNKSRERFAKIDMLKQEAVKKLFSSIMLSANAALIARGYSLPIVNELPEHLKECFVRNDLLEKKYLGICERILEAYNKVNDDKPFELWEFTQLSYEAELFIERMKTLIR